MVRCKRKYTGNEKMILIINVLINIILVILYIQPMTLISLGASLCLLVSKPGDKDNINKMLILSQCLFYILIGVVLV